MTLSTGKLCLGGYGYSSLPFPALASLPSLSTCNGRVQSRLVNTRSSSRAIGEVDALVALVPGIALPPSSRVGMVGCSKNRDPVTVGRVRTSRCCCPLPSIRPSVLSAGTLLLSTPRHLPAATSSGPLSSSDRFPWEAAVAACAVADLVAV